MVGPPGPGGSLPGKGGDVVGGRSGFLECRGLLARPIGKLVAGGGELRRDPFEIATGDGKHPGRPVHRADHGPENRHAHRQERGHRQPDETEEESDEHAGTVDVFLNFIGSALLDHSEEAVDRSHDSCLLPMIVSTVHPQGGHHGGFLHRSNLPAGLGLPRGRSRDCVHRFGFQRHKPIRLGLRFPEEIELIRREALRPHQILEGRGCAVRPRLHVIDGDEVPVDPLRRHRPRPGAVADLENPLVLRPESWITGDDVRPREAGEIVGALPQFVGEKIGAEAPFLRRKHGTLVGEHERRDPADSEEEHQQPPEGGDHRIPQPARRAHAIPRPVAPSIDDVLSGKSTSDEEPLPGGGLPSVRLGKTVPGGGIGFFPNTPGCRYLPSATGPAAAVTAPLHRPSTSSTHPVKETAWPPKKQPAQPLPSGSPSQTDHPSWEARQAWQRFSS